MEPGEERERRFGAGGPDLKTAAVAGAGGGGVTWRRRARDERWQDQVAAPIPVPEQERYWEADDVSECILLFGAFCNGE